MSNDLRLNSLERFQKNSERLVLEEHGHCEVPAGCGGVVLRWINPNSGVPVILHGGFADQMAIFVDEARAASGRVTVPYGEHVLAVHLVFDNVSTLYFWLAGLHDRPEDRYPDENRVIRALASAGDGSWLATFEDPGTRRWNAADFDDSQWTPLEATQLDNDSLDGSTQWRHDRMLRLQASSLDLRGNKEAWIRKTFRMEQ